MNPLPRFLGMALFVVLAVLAALLGLPVSRTAPPASPAVNRVETANAPSGVPASSLERNRRATVLSQRAALGLSLVGLVLAGSLVVSLAMRSGGPPGTRPPFAAARQEMDALTRLARNSAAQDAALSRERDVRRRAEEDAQLKQALLAQSVDEKIRLGRDLHDGIIQSLYAAGLTVETARSLLRTDPAQADRRLEEIRTNLNTAIRDVRGYITGLAPENLRQASFSRGVAALFEQLRAGRTAEFEIDVDDEAASRLSLEQSLEALQIAREAISNALRHGAAAHITVRMREGDGEICLLVQDDGRGFNPAQGREGGHGLGNMRARAGAVGAQLRLTSEPGNGARVVVTFPVSKLNPS